MVAWCKAAETKPQVERMPAWACVVLDQDDAG
jgi:hypothetical protein